MTPLYKPIIVAALRDRRALIGEDGCLGPRNLCVSTVPCVHSREKDDAEVCACSVLPLQSLALSSTLLRSKMLVCS